MAARPADIEVRRMAESDARRIGEIFRDAFNDLYRRRGYGLVVADASVGTSIADTYGRLDPEHCLVVTANGQVIGSGFLHARGATAGAGPITVHPRWQGRGAGSSLVREICRRADDAGVRSLRLVQDAFNETSFALYSRHGFVVRETLVRASCPAASLALRGRRGRGVRRADAGDIAAIVAMERALIGIERPRDYELLLRVGAVWVAGDEELRGSLARMVRGGIAVLGPAIATSLATLLDLVAAATADLAPTTDVRVLVPARSADLLTGLAAADLAVHSLCSYMVRGEYGGFSGYYVPTLFPESG